MSLIASNVVPLANQLFVWEMAEYTSAALVALACFGEYVADFTNWFTDGARERKERLAKISTLVLIGSLALELVCLVRTNQLSGQIVGSLDERARAAGDRAQVALGESESAAANAGLAEARARLADASSKSANEQSTRAESSASSAMTLARGARQEADSFEKDIVSAKERAAEAERHLAEALAEARRVQTALDAYKAPRTITDEQRLRIVSALKPFPETPYELAVDPLPEASAFVKIIDTLLRSAGWTNRGSARHDFRIVHPLPGGSQAEDVVASGLVVEVAKKNESKYGPAALALGGALMREGFSVRAEYLPDSDPSPDNVRVIVGVKE